MVDLSDLIARVESASGPDQDINREIALALGWTFGVEFYVKAPNGTPHGILPNWTASIDAALTLLPDDCRWSVDWSIQAPARNDRRGYRPAATCHAPDSHCGVSCGATPALALLSAILKKRKATPAEQSESHHDQS